MVLPLALTDEIVDPRLRIGGVGVGFGNRAAPYPRQIRMAISPARRGCREVRFPVGGARNARPGTVEPLGCRGASSPRSARAPRTTASYIAPRQLTSRVCTVMGPATLISMTRFCDTLVIDLELVTQSRRLQTTCRFAAPAAALSPPSMAAAPSTLAINWPFESVTSIVRLTPV